MSKLLLSRIKYLPEHDKSNEKGQGVLEFIMLLFMLLIFSSIVLIGANTVIATRWKDIVEIITKPTPDNITIRQ